MMFSPHSRLRRRLPLLPFAPLLRLAVPVLGLIFRHCLGLLRTPDGKFVSYHLNSRFCFTEGSIQTDILLPLSSLKFEGHLFYAPRDPHNYLIAEYDDYEILPPFRFRVNYRYTLEDIRKFVNALDGRISIQTTGSEARTKVTASLLINGLPVLKALVPISDGKDSLPRTTETAPLVSCLMVTRERISLAKRAVQSFMAQSYPNTELIIVDDDPDEALALWTAGLGNGRIRHVRLPDKGKPLGELRNIALKEARGTYLAQWDDDDFSSPERLRVQMQMMHCLHAQSCCLRRHYVWWPRRRRISVSRPRLWETSCLRARHLAEPYPAMQRGEDRASVLQVVQKGRSVLLDMPELCTTTVHRTNVLGEAHYEQLWNSADAVFEDEEYLSLLDEMCETMPFEIRVKGITDEKQ